MKYERALLKRAYNHKENADEETKEIIEKLMEAYNMCYGELREANTDIYDLRERLRRSKTEQPAKRRRRKKMQAKEEEPKVEEKSEAREKETKINTKTTFFGGANDN